MQQTGVVSGRKPGADLLRGLEGLVCGQAADAAQERGEVFAIDILHDEEVLAIDFANVIDATDVGVGDLARVAHFVVKMRECGSIALQRGCEKFEGHGVAELEVFRAVDLAHAAAAQQGHDAIALRE